MFGIGNAIRYFSTKPKPKMKPIELKTPPEQTQTITRVIFDIVRDHGPLTIAQTWDRVQEVGLRGLTSKRHMKIVMRWMRERQKLRLMCNHVGPHKQFLYTTWFTKPNFGQAKPQGHDRKYYFGGQKPSLCEVKVGMMLPIQGQVQLLMAQPHKAIKIHDYKWIDEGILSSLVEF